MGQFREISPEEKAEMEAEKKQKEEEEEKKAQSIKVGERCQVNNPKAPPIKRGTVMYVGKLSNLIVILVSVYKGKSQGRKQKRNREEKKQRFIVSVREISAK